MRASIVLVIALLSATAPPVAAQTPGEQREQAFLDKTVGAEVQAVWKVTPGGKQAAKYQAELNDRLQGLTCTVKSVSKLGNNAYLVTFDLAGDGFQFELPVTMPITFTGSNSEAVGPASVCIPGFATVSGSGTISGKHFQGAWTAGSADGTVHGQLRQPPPGQSKPKGGHPPDFWSDPRNQNQWRTWTPTDRFAVVFDLTADQPSTLSQALQQGNTPVELLMQEATAALLNASNRQVGYAYSATQVKRMVQAAFRSGSYDETIRVLSEQNRRSSGF